MPSNLRLQSSFEPVELDATFHTSPTFPPAKKQKMSLTNTYYVASTARSKLGREAGRPDHNLRRLVGHANLLDTLMVELADAEREQEAWFNQSVKKASKPEQPRHIQWIDTIAEATEEEFDSESDDGSDADDEDVEMANAPVLRRPVSPPITISTSAIDDEDDPDFDSDDDAEYEDDEYDGELTLTRVASKHSPPELTHDSDSDSDDESMPPSPESTVLELSEKQRQAIATTSFYSSKSQGGLDDYLTQRQHAPLIASY